MIYYLTQYALRLAHGTGWQDPLSFLRLFRYTTVRAAGAAITALLLSWWLGPRIIAWLRELKFGQQYEDKAEQAGANRVISKRGTPTMGGIMIVAVMDFTALLWAQWNTLMAVALLSVVVLMGLGFYDDYAKISEQNNRGFTSKLKLMVQSSLAIFIAVYLWRAPGTTKLISEVMVPFIKHPILSGAGGAAVGIVLASMTIVGSSNAVNLTDGLDGLAIGCTLIVCFAFLVLTYMAGNARMAEYLQIPYVHGASELTVFCAAMIGAGLGFLWFNCHPAQVFMGDTGSLALGGALGIVAVLIHQPLVLVIAGGVFVIEALSVMLQTSYFKYTRKKYGAGRRIFLMAPLHHHFEKKGWHESQVVMRFYILGVVCAVAALSTLKIR